MVVLHFINFFFLNIGFDSLQLLFWVGFGSVEANCSYRNALINADSIPEGIGLRASKGSPQHSLTWCPHHLHLLLFCFRAAIGQFCFLMLGTEF